MNLVLSFDQGDVISGVSQGRSHQAVVLQQFME